MIQATMRTNYFVSSSDSARQQNVLSVKLNPGLIDELPLPRPRFEIFVYSPRVEGVHLRFGFVARGGLRWSDRRESPPEILGLVRRRPEERGNRRSSQVFVKTPPAHRRCRCRSRRPTQREGVQRRSSPGC
jgi:glutamate dehydrogenase